MTIYANFGELVFASFNHAQEFQDERVTAWQFQRGLTAHVIPFGIADAEQPIRDPAPLFAGYPDNALRSQAMRRADNAYRLALEARRRGEPMQWAYFHQAFEHNHIASWLLDLTHSSDPLLDKLPRITWAAAVSLARRHHLAKEKREQQRRMPAGDHGTTHSIEAHGGAYWVRINTRQALDREGACMGHCVGDGSYDNVVGDETMVGEGIWSLRDRDGLSHATVEICDDYVERSLVFGDIKGPGNHRTLSSGSCRQFRSLIDAFKAAGHELGSLARHGILIGADGQTWRRDKAPPDVIAAYEAKVAEANAAVSVSATDLLTAGVDTHGEYAPPQTYVWGTSVSSVPTPDVPVQPLRLRTVTLSETAQEAHWHRAMGDIRTIFQRVEERAAQERASMNTILAAEIQSARPDGGGLLVKADIVMEIRRVDLVADALIAGDEEGAAQAVADLRDEERDRVMARARIIVCWHKISGGD